MQVDLTVQECSRIAGALEVYKGYVTPQYGEELHELKCKIRAMARAMALVNDPRYTDQHEFIVVKEQAGAGPLKWFPSEKEAYQFATEMAAKYPSVVYHVMAPVRSVRARAEAPVIEDVLLHARL